MVIGQIWKNSCGAACLLCAAIELGVADIPAWPPICKATTKLEGTQACQDIIYRITSGAVDKPSPETVNLTKEGYSMPQNIFRAAKHLGLDRAVYADQTNPYAVAILKDPKYKSCFADCKLDTDATVDDTKAAPTPNAKQRSLLVMHTGSGLHYIMLRDSKDSSGEECMDPAPLGTGTGHKTLGDAIKKYTYTGIAIVLTKK